jgi:hypothetical protein
MSCRRGFMSIHGVSRIRLGALGAAAALLGVSLTGCVSMSDGEGARLNERLRIYAPFDNERDSGPSFLAGPPQADLGPRSSAVDPSAPPLEDTPQELEPPP